MYHVTIYKMSYENIETEIIILLVYIVYTYTYIPISCSKCCRTRGRELGVNLQENRGTLA